MFLAMNRFRIVPGREEAFEEVWRARDSRLGEVPGFRSFHLLRGPSREGHTLYASHIMWDDEAAFLAWTRSENFRAAHAGAADRHPLYLGPPEFEGFKAVLSD